MGRSFRLKHLIAKGLAEFMVRPLGVVPGSKDRTARLINAAGLLGCRSSFRWIDQVAQLL